ncbi:nuclear transport factor 2 family protein [Dyella sp.]|uniref:nuclear transport factor 2 family protein n=1 Tax=Dyella sp. TaxID=1869338 RepID=UPI002B4A4F88|nr:hypothetical protein [Dyella sp.]HKT29631.1 hypothetical protein [Dyella sp.]
MKTRILLAATLLVFAGSATAVDQPDAPAAQDVAGIQHVMNAYHHALAAHDGQAVSALFLDQRGLLVTALSDQAFAAAKAKDPAKQKVRIMRYQDFAKFVANTKSTLDPRHTDMQIRSDGTVASVYFHFDFVVDGNVENRGDETWQLIKTADGWRIVAITYSSNPGAA